MVKAQIRVPLNYGSDDRSTANDATAASLAERFDALAAGGGTDGSAIEVGRIDDAFARLRSDSGSVPLLLPSAALRSLASVDPEAAGDWVIGLSRSLHRCAPGRRLDLVTGGGALAITSTDTTTVFEECRRKRRRSERDAVAIGSAPRLAQLAFGLSKPGLRGRSGVPLLGAIAGAVHPIADLLADGVDVDPYALWALAAASLPAVPVSRDFTLVHRSTRSGRAAATVTSRPGRPLGVARGESTGAELVVTTAAGATLGWAFEGREPVEIDGDPERLRVAREVVRSAFEPARPAR